MGTTAWIIMILVILHFVIGIGLLAYKMSTPKKNENSLGQGEEKSDSV